jgi:hypothetical protein
MTVRSNFSIYNNVAVTAWYKRNCPGSLKPAVFSALASIIQQHAIFSAIPVDTNISSHFFARLQLIDLNQAVTFTKIDGFDHGCEKFQARLSPTMALLPILDDCVGTETGMSLSIY